MSKITIEDKAGELYPKDGAMLYNCIQGQKQDAYKAGASLAVEFAEWCDYHAIRAGEHMFTCKVDNHKTKHTTSELFTIFLNREQ